jgi:hypothetical protein
MKKLTLEKFIERANKVHNYKFNYSKSVYLGRHIPTIIICPNLHEFKQTPNSHMNGKGCAICSGKIRLTKEEFIRRSRIIHNDKYEYDKINFIDAQTEVEITCKIHGSFFQSPTRHSRYGCPRCGNAVRFTTEEFIEKARKIHGDKYIYTKVNYKNALTEVEIICPKPEHGSFFQSPNRHYSYGCPVCAGNQRLTTEIFIERSRLVHGDKYIYNKTNYINRYTKVIITCPRHGDFKQQPANHWNGCGCRKCTMNCISKKEIAWIILLNNPNIKTQHRININNTYINVDGFDPITNTVYEFYGDFWHGNPKVYDHNKVNWANNISFKELYNRTIEREKLLKELGYNIISCWESDIELSLANINIIKKCKECGIEGDDNLFHGNICRKCKNIKSKLYYKKNKEDKINGVS